VRPAARAHIGALVAVLAGLLAASCSSSTHPGGRESAGPPTTALATRPAAAARAPAAPPGKFTVAFAGDVHFSGRLAPRLARDPATVFAEAAPVLRRADLTMVNLETAIATSGSPAAKEFTFAAPPSALTALRDAGIDVATMANNHGADYGEAGLRQTLRAITRSRFPVVGIGRDAAAAFAPYTTTLHGVPVAIFGADQVQDETTLRLYSAGPHKPGVANAYSARLLRAVRHAARAGYTVIVYVHWGIEYTNCPDADQQALAAALAHAGASAVVGAHVHELQGAGWRPDGTYIAYGLGNYLWWLSFGNVQDDNGVLTLRFDHRRVVGASLAPSRLDQRGVPMPATGAVARAIRGQWAADRQCAHLAGTRPPR
jgi:poly-gamma-glutamate capsule biosynthesis protein CapA/YwtB (metallophosphatase superfamily)